MFRSRRTFFAFGVALVWGSAVIAGFGSLWRYGNTAGAQPVFGSQWPAASRIPHDPHQFTLVIFMHPQCPCSTASVAELTRVMTLCQGRLISRVVFVKPMGFPAGWEQTSLWRDAEKIPGTFVSCDPGGAEARLFGAMTSGQTALYDPAGDLLFQGGITESRGHAGDNAGCDAIVDIVLHQNAAKISSTRHGETAVFGCALFDDAPSHSDARSSTR